MAGARSTCAPGPPPCQKLVPLASPTPAPLAHLALRALLLSDFDDDSRSVVESALLLHVPIERVVGLMQETAVLAALAPYPNLVDAARTHLASHPKAGRQVLERTVARYRAEQSRSEFGSPAALAVAHAVVAVCERMLCTGLFKRDIRGPQLPTDLANLVRGLRKACHKMIPAEDGIGHWRLPMISRSQPGGPAARLPATPAAPDAAALKRLDQWCG